MGSQLARLVRSYEVEVTPHPAISTSVLKTRNSRWEGDRLREANKSIISRPMRGATQSGLEPQYNSRRACIGNEAFSSYVVGMAIVVVQNWKCVFTSVQLL